MKKRVVIILVVASCLLAVGLFVVSPFTFSTGIYVDAGEPIIVFDEGSAGPVVMRGRTGNYRTGDRILILHDGTMMLSYPAQMNVFFCIRLEKGDEASVPEEVMESLKELGWL